MQLTWFEIFQTLCFPLLLQQPREAHASIVRSIEVMEKPCLGVLMLFQAIVELGFASSSPEPFALDPLCLPGVS